MYASHVVTIFRINRSECQFKQLDFGNFSNLSTVCETNDSRLYRTKYRLMSLATTM
jgi:hypothetical protein